MDDLLQDFVAEALDLCAEVESGLMDLERDPGNQSVLNSIFRAFHTVKGGAGFLSIKPIVDTCHATENIFDKLRTDKSIASQSVIDLSFRANSYVTDQLTKMQQGISVSDISHPPNDLCILLGLSPGAHEAEQTPQPVELFERSNIPWDAYYASVVPNADMPAVSTSGQALSPDRTPPKSGRETPTNAKLKEETIKIDAGKLDAILEAADETVHATGQASAIAEELAKGQIDQAKMAQLLSSLAETLSRAKRHSHSLQKATLSTRMVPVGRLFQKFPKIVRDLARDLSKSVTLVIEGAETEIDRVVVDGLYEPMVHMLRNALDHGIEDSTERRLAGKSDDATVRLSARQEGSVVVIEVQDDGRGMSPSKIRAKAVQKQLLSEDAQLTDDECLDLIFLPGFSTKEVATNVSGRGVGMDVVRTAVESNRGTISIASKLGAGTTFSIRVPIALSIAPVMVIRSKHALIGLPSGLITRVVDLTSRPEQSILGARTYVDQGLPLTVRSLASSLGYATEREDCGLVIATESPYVLSVPAIEGLVDLVVKPFTAIASEGVSGTARSTSGEIVLILDPLYVANGCRPDKKSHLRS